MAGGETSPPATSSRADQAAEPTPGERDRFAPVLLVLWPAGLVVILFLLVGRLGLQPTDDGNLLAQTYRLLHGQVPHRDVIFARPMGSGYLHVLDYLVPMPLFEAARFIGIAEIVAYSLLLARLVFDVAPRRWGPARSLAAAAGALINMHTFPLMGWYTTDGLSMTAGGFVALSKGLREDRPWLRRTGLLLLGAAPLTKQSFFLAPILGLALVIRESPPGRRVERAVTGGALMAVPFAAYTLMLASRGALGDFVDQVAGAKTVWGGSFLTAFGDAGPRGHLLFFLGAIGGLLITGRLIRGRTGGFDLAARATVTGVVIWFVVSSHLSYRSTWGLGLVWTALLVVVWRAITERTIDRAGILVVAAGWMTSLSWGYEVPNLVAGTAALYLVDRAWRGAVLPARFPRAAIAAGLAAAVAASALVGAAFAQARYRHPYGDRPAAELTATLANVSPDFGHIRTNPNTASYLNSLASCVRSHPAYWTAVLPDNPGIYPALRLRNPFPLDWLYVHGETAGHETSILDAARRLEREGRYLVLFETFPPTALQRAAPLPEATASSLIYGGPLMMEIRADLHGSPVVCGYFVGVYQPR